MTTLSTSTTAPAYKIREISTLKGTAMTYVLADFLDALGAVVYTEEFIMQLANTGTRIVTNASGWLGLTDGTFIDPATVTLSSTYKFLRETFTVDVPSVIKANLDAHNTLRNAKGWTGDHTVDASKPLYVNGKLYHQNPNALMQRDTVDPLGILARADVQAMVGVTL